MLCWSIVRSGWENGVDGVDHLVQKREKKIIEEKSFVREGKILNGLFGLEWEMHCRSRRLVRSKILKAQSKTRSVRKGNSTVERWFGQDGNCAIKGSFGQELAIMALSKDRSVRKGQ